MRVLGVDLGERRIGVAVSDGTGTLATPRCTIVRQGDPEADRAALVAEVEAVAAQHVVVGLPLSLDGGEGPAARAALREIDALRALLAPRGVGVEAFDERLTTVTAERSPLVRSRRGTARRQVVDQVAAAVLLQAWLDGRHGRGDVGDGT